MLRRVETWLWFIRDSVSDKLRVTRVRMTADDAETIHPGALRVPGTMEYIEIEQSRETDSGFPVHAWTSGAEAAPEVGD